MPLAIDFSYLSFISFHIVVRLLDFLDNFFKGIWSCCKDAAYYHPASSLLFCRILSTVAYVILLVILNQRVYRPTSNGRMRDLVKCIKRLGRATQKALSLN
jgi:hypothetical protein